MKKQKIIINAHSDSDTLYLHAKMLEQQNKKFDKQWETIERQGKTLDRQSKILERHTKKLNENDKRFDRMIGRLVEHDSRLDYFKEHMATKADMREIMNTLDKLLGLYQKHDQEIIMMV